MNFNETRNKWKNLSDDELISLRDELEDYLTECAYWYAKEIDVWDFYYELTNSVELKNLMKDSALPIDWDMDLHVSDSNYTNFVECLSDVVFYLSQVNDTYYFQLIGWGVNKNFTLASIIENKFEE